MRAHSLLHSKAPYLVLGKLLRSRDAQAQLHEYIKTALLLLVTLSVTAPLAIGVGTLLAWHIGILRQVHAFAMPVGHCRLQTPPRLQRLLGAAACHHDRAHQRSIYGMI